MVQGNFAGGDYFIDCGSASQYVVRAIFGVWVTVCVAVIASCVRSVFRSTLASRVLASNADSHINLWRVSPATTVSEALEVRSILTRALVQGNFFYVLSSFVCVVSALVGAASTTISNHAVVTNIVTRSTAVQGRLVTDEHTSLSGALVNVTARVRALEAASAPLEQLFDFTPDDASHWVFVPGEWNNTWKGACTYSKYPAVDLTVYPTNSSNFQDEVPSLGAWLPQWASIDSARQGTAYSGFYIGAAANGTGAWRDIVVTYLFGTTDPVPSSSISTYNISLANFIAHEVARDPDTTFQQSSFKSDVQVVECVFDTATPGAHDQAYGESASYVNAVQNVANVFTRSVVDASIAGQAVAQPTAHQMLRYWQAHVSVKDAQYPHAIQRPLSVLQPVVQIRLSVLVTTLGCFVIAVAAATVSRALEPRDLQGKRLSLPSSQLDWIVQAAREHRKAIDADPVQSPAAYSVQHGDLAFAVSTDTAGQCLTWVTSMTDVAVTSNRDRLAQSFAVSEKSPSV